MSVVSVLTRSLATTLFAPIATSPKIWTGIVDPTHSNDTTVGVKIGDWWLNTVTGNEFRAISVGAGAAVWRHVPRIMGQGGPVTAPVDTTEDVLATVSIPAGAMGINGVLNVVSTWLYTNSANTKTLRVRLGGAGGTQALALGLTTTAMYTDLRFIANQGAQNVQAFHDRGSASGVSTSSGVVNSAAIDTSAATTLVFTGQKATGAETLTLLMYKVELTRPDIT